MDAERLTKQKLSQVYQNREKLDYVIDDCVIYYKIMTMMIMIHDDDDDDEEFYCVFQS